MLDVDLRLLAIFEEIYRTKSVSQAAENLGEDPTLGIEDVIHARSSGASEGSIDGMFGEEEQLVRDSGFHGRMDLFISPRFPKC